MAKPKPHPGGVKRLDVTVRRAMVADLYLRSVPIGRIGERIGVKNSIVRKDIKALNDEWTASAQRSIRQKKARELQRINRVEYEAWRAWERSKSAGKLAEGNPKFLELVMSCVDKRAKLLGLFAPKKAQLDVNVGQRPEWIEHIDRLSAQEIAKGRSAHELARAHRSQVTSHRALLTDGTAEN